jgi:hypothetical protein
MTRDTPDRSATRSAGQDPAPTGTPTTGHLPVAGQSAPRLGRSPFGPAAPSIAAALLYAAAAVVWVIAGRALPGGRWLAIHLFTLGTLTNLILVFTEHFGRTLTRTMAERIRWQMPVANLGILMVLVGLPEDQRWLTGTGAVVVTAVVTVSYVRLRRMRKDAVGARFGWIVRMYERAHGAFIHGAMLGLLMGVGLLSGTWYLAAKWAHLHINILGWAGLTLLATLVFFGPTIVRTRIVEGADDRAARALRLGATGLTASVLLLLGTGVGGTPATGLRIASALTMGIYAWAVTVVCLPVGTAARAAKPSAPRWPLVAASAWFPIVAWADVAVITSGRWRLLDPVGLAMLLGVLVQVITAVLVYLAPMLRMRSFGDRDRLRARLEVGATARVIAFNLGTAAVVGAAILRGELGATLSRGGWTLVIASLLWLLAVGVSPPPRAGTKTAVAAG